MEKFHHIDCLGWERRNSYVLYSGMGQIVMKSNCGSVTDFYMCAYFLSQGVGLVLF